METYVRIEDTTNYRTIPWERWEYLDNLLDTFLKEKDVVILKARQLGISWLVCAYALWKAVFFENAKVLIFSMGQNESWEMLRKIRFMYNALPAPLKKRISSDRKDSIEFSDNNSKILAMPSTEHAGTSYTASLVIRDELDKHPYAMENFAAVGPTVDAGGQMIDLSTRDKKKGNSHFIDRYLKARNKESNAKAVFLGWRLRPVRAEGISLDEWFEENVRKKYPPFQIEQEYPEVESDALSDSKTVPFFDAESLNWYLTSDCYPPIQTDFDDMLRIWKHPAPGVRYIVFTDPSDGGGDPHAIGVMDATTGEVVAISHGKCKAEKVAEIHDHLVRRYNNAFNEFELNHAVGTTVGEALTVLQTPNRRINKTGKDRKHAYGWWTGQSGKANVRDQMLYGLEVAVRQRNIRLHYTEAVAEMRAMIKPDGEKPQVPRGKHDDLIMMLSGLLQIKDEVINISGLATQYSLKPSRARGL